MSDPRRKLHPTSATSVLLDRLRRDGIAQIGEAAKELDLDPKTLSTDARRLVERKHAVQLWRGVIALPDVAEAIQRAVAQANRTRAAQAGGAS